jgi:stage V sporulation protein R
MELVDQHTKNIMEGCKDRARAAGLRFGDETLEYIVTNRDLLELSPKLMIPTLYDYWVHDVEVLKEKGKYELYPGNPYETVINTRPAISFYNDNNPDWLNVMIFYHVIGHIDFFQNNQFFRHTWDYDFTGQALSDKRMIAKLRSEKGRWVDYVIEFARGVDNLVGYFQELSRLNAHPVTLSQQRLDFYFNEFLQVEKKVGMAGYIKEISRYNECQKEFGKECEKQFFAEVVKKYAEFEEIFKKSLQKRPRRRLDLMEFLMAHSEFLNREENRWMKQILQVVRNTALFFQPQIRTKIMNEGWASFWHEILFLSDDRITGHEVDFARVHAGVTSMPRVGLNPYALGMRLFDHTKGLVDKGKYSFEFRRVEGARERDEFDAGNGDGLGFIFDVRKYFNDFMFVNTFIDQEFVNRHRLFVADRRLNQSKMVWEYFVKSRRSDDYRDMVLDKLYHPPHITVKTETGPGNILYLDHKFEEKPLVTDYIAGTLLGIEYLWGAPVKLETSEVVSGASVTDGAGGRFQWPAYSRREVEEPETTWQRVVYTMENRKLTKAVKR